MKEITHNDILQLRHSFKEYCNTAEQHQFPILLMIDINMQRTLRYYQNPNRAIDQGNMNAMFRAVLKVMGKDYSAYC